jgi:tRNA (guanine-N(7)-)-methyltransferase subunit TRM82
MPKRPSAISISHDARIICADKFGDVYSLPLIPDGKVTSSSSLLPKRGPKSFSKPAASEFTVHSKRNLNALQDQMRQAELGNRNKTKLDEPDFQLTLLLGHVSMLTDLVLTESQSRRYILTSDRDEHIRVSRDEPHAHIIESYCLGHKQFVGAMVLAKMREDVLISGGGDDELFVWDWKAGKLLSKSSVLRVAQEINPALDKVAVSQLYSFLYPSEGGPLTYVLAICQE